jgi:hypothetical protein
MLLSFSFFLPSSLLFSPLLFSPLLYPIQGKKLKKLMKS